MSASPAVVTAGPRRLRLGTVLPWLALIAVYVLWGTTCVAIRVAVAGEPPFAIAAVGASLRRTLVFGTAT